MLGNTILITKLFKRWTVGVFIEEGKNQTTAVWRVNLTGKLHLSPYCISPRNVNTTTPVQAFWHMGKYTLAQNTGHV